MRITVLDDYQDALRTFASFEKLGGHDVQICNEHVRDVEALAELLKDTEALLLMRERTPVSRALLERLPKLRLISQFGKVPHIDLHACAGRGVTVCSRIVPGRPSYATAELTWGLVLAAWRRIPQEAASLQAGGWQTREAIGSTLRGKTFGVFGYGRIGAVVSGYAHAFGMNVLVWGREGSRERARAQGHAAAADQESFFRGADVISLHLDLTPATRGIVRLQDLRAMKQTALFVNTSRAGLVQEGALVAALREGRPGRAAVDVFEVEPVPAAGHPLLSMRNVVATPHLGYVERESLQLMYETMVDQVLAFARGEPLNVVVPAAA